MANRPFLYAKCNILVLPCNFITKYYSVTYRNGHNFGLIGFYI